MTAHALKTSPLSVVKTHPLSVEKSYEEHETQIDFLTGLAWQIAYTSLWNGEQFSKKEINLTKEIIHLYISCNPCHNTAFNEFVQRTLMARYYLLYRRNSYVPLPSNWLNPDNKKGFAGTEKWMETIKEARRSAPLYKQTLKAFPEAVRETITSQKAADFHYWRSYFAERNAPGLLNLFLSVIANCTYTPPIATLKAA